MKNAHPGSSIIVVMVTKLVNAYTNIITMVSSVNQG